MTSYIRILRICQYCGNEFTANTTVTKYCGDRCAKRAYKERKKIEQIKASNEKVTSQIQRPIKELQSKEFLSIADTCQLFNVSRTTVYRMLKNQRIKSAKMGRRVIIRKTELLNLFN